MTPVNVRIPDDLRDRIDVARGLIPREAWVRAACEAALVAPSQRLLGQVSETDGPLGHGEQVQGAGVSLPPVAVERQPRVLGKGPVKPRSKGKR
jgi:hypothetical protein